MDKYIRTYKKYGFMALFLNARLRHTSNSEIVIKEKGFKYPIFIRTKTSDIHVFNQIFRSREYDLNYKINPQIIIDLGANTGLSSVLFANKFPESKIIAVEPEKSNYEYLLKNTEYYKNITCLNKAIWNETKQLNIIDSGRGEWGFITEEQNPASDLKEFLTISSVSMNDILEMFSIENIDILKIDIEGAEVNLFKDNYNNWISKVKLLIIELHDRWKPGSAKAFFNAMINYDFEFDFHHENVICYLK